MAETLSPTQIIELAQTVERCGEAFYDAVLEQRLSSEVRTLVRRLRDDERQHGTSFGALAAAEPAATGPAADPDRMAFLSALSRYQVFPDPEAARAFVLAIDGEAALLRHAINFEKDTILLLHELRSMVGDANHALVDRLIDEERDHVRVLDRLLRGRR